MHSRQSVEQVENANGADGIDPGFVRRFHATGYHAPLRIIDEAAMVAVRDEIEAAMQRPGPAGNPSMARHLDCAAIRTCCRSPVLVAHLRRLLGPDLQVWNTFLWNKAPGGKAIPWHQDIDYWPIEPPLTVSAWLAIDATDEVNSCVQIIPASHRRSLPHVPAAPDDWFSKRADPRCFDTSGAVSVPLRPGECLLFTERLLHHSTANRSDRRRLGLSIRFATPYVEVLHDEPPLFPGHRSLWICGEDRAGLNRYL